MAEKIGYDNIYGDATITVTGEDTGYEKEYLGNYSPSIIWQYTSIGTLTISGDFGSAKAVKIVGIFNTNMTSSDTTFSVGFGSTAAAIDSTHNLLTEVDSAGNAVIEVDENYRYFKFTLDKVSGTATQAGLIYMGTTVYELEQDLNRDYTEGTLSVFEETTGTYGQINRSELKFSKELISGNIRYMHNEQKVLLDETIRKEKYVLFYDTERDKWFYGILELGEPVFKTTNYYSMSLNFEEAL